MTDLRTGIEVDKLSQIFDEIKRGILPKPMFINVINAAILKLIEERYVPKYMIANCPECKNYIDLSGYITRQEVERDWIRKDSIK